MGRGMSCVEVGDSDSESERERCRWCDLRICLCNQRMVLRLAPRRISCRRSANGSGWDAVMLQIQLHVLVARAGCENGGIPAQRR